MTSYETIRIEHEGPLTWIVLNRPEAANSLSIQMLNELSAALEALKTEGGPVLAIRGEGKGFCAGMALDQYGGAGKGGDPVADRDRLAGNVNRWLAIWDHPKPVIAAVHGYCMAVGSQMICFTDITIATEDCKIGEPTVPIGGGFIAPVWSTLVGPKRAKEMAFVAGNTIDGKTAVEWGLANHAVPPERLLDAVRELAARIAMVPPDVLHIKKLAINRSAEAQGFRQAVQHGAEMDALLHLAPSVIAVKDRIKEVGLKQVMAEYRTPSTMSLGKAAK